MVSTRLILSGLGWEEREVVAMWLIMRGCSFTTESDQRKQQQWGVKTLMEEISDMLSKSRCLCKIRAYHLYRVSPATDLVMQFLIY